MFYARLLDVIHTWLTTGRFPRDELRVRPAIAVPFGVVLLALAVAFVDHALGG